MIRTPGLALGWTIHAMVGWLRGSRTHTGTERWVGLLPRFHLLRLTCAAVTPHQGLREVASLATLHLMHYRGG